MQDFFRGWAKFRNQQAVLPPPRTAKMASRREMGPAPHRKKKEDLRIRLEDSRQSRCETVGARGTELYARPSAPPILFSFSLCSDARLPQLAIQPHPFLRALSALSGSRRRKNNRLSHPERLARTNSGTAKCLPGPPNVCLLDLNQHPPNWPRGY